MKVRTLGMLFGTLLWAASMGLAAPQAAGTNDQGTQANQGAQTEQGTQPGTQTTTTTTQQQPAQGTAAAPPAQTGAPAQGRRLPRTASEAPLAGMFGLLALGAAAGVRFLNRRTA